MKFILSILVCIQSLYAISFTPEEQAFIEAHPIIKISNEKDWPPFDFNEEGVAKGYSVDYLKLLSKKIGVEFVFEMDKWSNLVEKIKNNEIDVIHPLVKNEEREQFLNYMTNHIDLDFSIVMKIGSKKIKSLKDLKGKTVAVVKGWNSTKFLEENYPKINFKYYSSSKEKFEAVAFAEVDATIDGYFVANYLIQKYILSNLTITSKINDNRLSSKLYIAVRKDWNIFRNILQKTMNSISSEELILLNIKWIKVYPEKKAETIHFSKEEKTYLKNKKTIVMCIDPNWMPYEKNDNGKHIGMSSDYFKHFQTLIPAKIEYLPTNSWAQTLEFAKNRKCDILSLAVKTPLRSKYLNFSTPYLKLPLVIATKPTTPFILDVNDIIDKKIGVVKGHAYIELLKNRFPNIKLVEVNSLKEGFEKILDDKIYGFLDSLVSVGYDIQKEYLGNIKIAGKLDIELEIGVATRNDEKILNSIFEKVVNSLNDKIHREILNKWVSVQYNKSIDKTVIFKISIFLFVVSLFFIYRQFLLKRQNKVLQDSNDEFEHLINSTIEAIFILENGKIIDSNYEAVKLLNAKSKAEILGLHALSIIEFSYHEIASENLEQNYTSPYEVNAVKQDGTIFPVLIKGHKFRLKNREIRVSAMIDLSELKSKEKLLLEQTKMAAIGEMLGNISHQWRQPLSIISTATSGMKVQKAYGMLTDDTFDEYSEAIMNNVKYLSHTIEDFKNFIQENKEVEVFNLLEHIKKDISILNPMLKDNSIHLILDIKDTILITNLENELTQAILNIISNAKDAFIENNIHERYIIITATEDKNRTIISLQDSAGGIPSDVIPKIFEPYFTTKHKSQGTGLGLYMTRKIIVDSMKGSIEVSNKEFDYEGQSYKGANFRLTL